MLNKVLIVCVGNICRSPMAEAILKNQAKISNLPINVSSAGIGALIGSPADPIVQALLREDGIDCSEHRARQVTTKMFLESELILVMEKEHRIEIERISSIACGKVHLLGKWSNFEIPDPYKKSKQIFENTACLIKQGINEWREKLWR